MTLPPHPTPDAHESNAGDDFHLLWAARRALRMLTPASLLTAISIEGPGPAEVARIDPGGSKLLGIDVTEYYGGATFMDASHVVHSQLKYSTRQSAATWTAARLTEGKQGTKAGSVIHRLSKILLAYLKAHGRVEVLRRIKLALVSNRPCGVELLAALSAARDVLRKSDAELSFAHLRRQVEPNHHSHLLVFEKVM